MREMDEARELQAIEKERLLAEQAKQERDEFLRIVQQQKEERVREQQVGDQQKNILHEHSKQLRAQIQQKEEIKKQERLDYLEEGKIVRQEQEAQKRKLEHIKQKKLEEMGSLGIPDKYKADLAKKKVDWSKLDTK